ncbi:tryptophan-rich sensory protein [Flavobacterium psychrophilum]|uniref:Tryptophan-rich sensory protein n=1 Tax=Flavobacterium psychrophilum TaxID=96345 RepID=A0A1Z5HIU9_FLAPS|nr:TspO/MBR family protein [Flavobacterium psychrophilum]AIN73226.1 CrtK [Flavobacterium psychrophilum FPG3]EKT2070326.1 tryptophan-rich sensory protein [Flavobacterium psychrophilum]EKT2072661.1 tryptophan-rich sensory protein [Flavobacterium psychrophilum]EKT3964754.1 tryptophan-rich sensory protein [Flavobacterium psychrophilum]EKT3966755.1 tryptophan-rich sensory protein [Flavobacterium psychrophilum]
MKKAKLTKIIISISACVLVGLLSSLATQSSVNTWFLTLKKPFFNPPSWIFPLVWTILYILMGYSFAIIWSNESQSKRNKETIKKAMFLFAVQLALNALWSVLFFGLCNPFLALIEILLLWLMILETIKMFTKIDDFASKLLIPYLAWVSFAVILNGSIWFLNS